MNSVGFSTLFEIRQNANYEYFTVYTKKDFLHSLSPVFGIYCLPNRH